VQDTLTKFTAPALAAAFLAACGAGCAKPGYDQYVPATSAARQALEAGLNHWQGGNRPGRVAAGPPAVTVVDSKWQAGDQLAGFEVLEEQQGEDACWFKVRLKLKKPAGEQVVRYAVLGKDPLWVYREEDFKKVSGM
jgi:hypothetical protein